METVKLVIEMPKELYDALDKPVEDESWLRYIVKKGKLLPKGHGRLIDADAFDVGQVVDKYGDICGYKYITKYELDNAPTIVEADRGIEK